MPEKFKNLKPQSIATLQPLISFWSSGNPDKAMNLERSLNDKLEINTTDAGSLYCAEYAITYAVLLDDKELLRDLCEKGANLHVRDGSHAFKTPIEVAADYGRAGIMEILMRHGAAIDKINISPSYSCSNPLTFFWTVKENWLCNREADFNATHNLLLTTKKTK